MCMGKLSKLDVNIEAHRTFSLDLLVCACLNYMVKTKIKCCRNQDRIGIYVYACVSIPRCKEEALMTLSRTHFYILIPEKKYNAIYQLPK